MQNNTLPETLIPCRTCGIGVPREAAQDVEMKRIPRLEWNLSHPGRAQMPTYYVDAGEFTQCDECTARREEARTVLRRLPGVASRLGNTAAEQLAMCLDVLAAVGHPELAREETGDGARLLAMIRVLRPVGGAVQCEAHDSPAPTIETGRWEHVGTEQRETLLDAVGQLLARRKALHSEPVKIPAPNGRGCMMCGVAAIERPAVEVIDRGGLDAAQAALWTHKRADPRVIGGEGSTSKIEGVICAACEAAVELTGAIGQSAMAHAYAAHLKREGEADVPEWARVEDLHMDGVMAWAVSGRRRPSATPWEHLMP